MFIVYGLLFNDFKLAIWESKLAQIFKMVAKQATLYLIFHMMKKYVYFSDFGTDSCFINHAKIFLKVPSKKV